MTGYAAYNNMVAQTTENKEEILLMLYDGALKFINSARLGIENNNPKIRGENISKIINIITELDCALDREIDIRLVENLSSLYQYMINRLTIANVKKNTDAIDEVKRLLVQLKDGFKEAAKKNDDTSLPDQVSSPDMEPKKRAGVFF